MKGSTRKRGSKWTAYWWTKDAAGQWRQHSKGGFKRERDAQSHLNQILPKLDDGSWQPDSSLTVTQLLTEHYLPARRSEGLRASTIKGYEDVASSWITPHIGSTQLQRLTPDITLKWIDKLHASGNRKGEPLGPRSVQLSVTVLKAATSWALANGYISRDPLLGFKRPRGGTSQSKSAWTIEEAQAFLRAVRGDRFESAWWLWLTHGLRRGEVAGLTWHALDLKDGVLRVTETLIVVGGGVQRSEPKTAAGRRSIKLDPHVVALLKQHRHDQRLERLAAGEIWEDTGYVFTDKIGQPWHPDRLSDRFVKLAADAGLRKITLHELRHTAASIMISKHHLDPTLVATILGHSTPKITMEIYRHLFHSEMDDAAGKMTATLLGDIESTSA